MIMIDMTVYDEMAKKVETAFSGVSTLEEAKTVATKLNMQNDEISARRGYGDILHAVSIRHEIAEAYRKVKYGGRG